MIFNRSLAILLILFTISGIFGCSNPEYVEYRPHYLSDDNETKRYGSSNLDSIEFKSIVKVLDQYHEDYKITPDGKVLIHRKLANDWELVWNYTEKAKAYRYQEIRKKSKEQQPTTKPKAH